MLGGGKWFILYQPKYILFYLNNDMIPFFSTFQISGAWQQRNWRWKWLVVEKRIPCGKCAMVKMSGGGKSCSQEYHCSNNTLPWGGGKWFILYQPKIYYSILTMVYLFSTFSDFRSLAAKDMKLKMSCGRKKIHVENAPWWKSLEVEKVAAKSVSGWKTPCGQTCHCLINTLSWG